MAARAVAVEADLTDRGAVSEMARELESALGVVDVLVNNAAVAGGAGQYDLLELDDELWYETVDANLNSVYLVTKAFLRGMVDAGRGSIVNISSAAGRAGQPRMGAYCATKFAVIGLTQQLALEFGPAIRVNCVSPGPTDTDMMAGTFARRDAAAGRLPAPPRPRASRACRCSGWACPRTSRAPWCSSPPTTRTGSRARR